MSAAKPKPTPPAPKAAPPSATIPGTKGGAPSTSSPNAAPGGQAGASPVPGEAVPGEPPKEGEVEIPKPPSVKTMTVVQYLAMVDNLILEGLQSLVIARPENPVEYMSDFLKEKDPMKKPPTFHISGPAPPVSSCRCRAGPPLPITSCGCYDSPGWTPSPDFPPVGWPNRTSVEYLDALDRIVLP